MFFRWICKPENSLSGNALYYSLDTHAWSGAFQPSPNQLAKIAGMQGVNLGYVITKTRAVIRSSLVQAPGTAQSIPILATASLLAGCSRGVLVPQRPIGAAEKTIVLNSLGIMLAIIVPTIIATFGIAWWFRSSNSRARYLPSLSLFAHHFI